MQLDDGAAAEEEKERLRVQRKANKQKRRDQSRQKSAVESAEPGSGAPDIDSDKQECEKQSVAAVGGAGASIHHLGASDAPLCCRCQERSHRTSIRGRCGGQRAGGVHHLL